MAHRPSPVMTGAHSQIGIKNDPLMTDCHTTELKRSFHDIDYMMLGYNVLKGFPLSLGHDPGFTFPIFQANYAQKFHSADCRYSLPAGYTAVPDVSCLVSFSSQVSQSEREYSSSLKTHANIEGGGWGVSFSANFAYNKASSEISSGKSLRIQSTAKCTYYFAKLKKYSPPPFHSDFLKWANLLKQKPDEDTYLEFFDYYGTHYTKTADFGARFSYEYIMKSKTLKTTDTSSMSISARASYSGLFSVSGGFGMDTSKKSAASDFSKSVETKTITEGAPPPANGDVLTWASTVKENPVPVKYTLGSIEDLFSPPFMDGMTVVANRIKQYKGKYCKKVETETGRRDICNRVLGGRNGLLSFETQAACGRIQHRGGKCLVLKKDDRQNSIPYVALGDCNKRENWILTYDGRIFHLDSALCLQRNGWSPLLLRSSCEASSSSIKWTFSQGAMSWGFIKQTHSTKNCIHPKNGALNSPIGNPFVAYPLCQETSRIQYKFMERDCFK